MNGIWEFLTGDYLGIQFVYMVVLTITIIYVFEEEEPNLRKLASVLRYDQEVFKQIIIYFVAASLLFGPFLLIPMCLISFVRMIKLLLTSPEKYKRGMPLPFDQDSNQEDVR